MKTVEDETILKEICESNGINFESFQRHGVDSQTSELELFFSGLPRMINLKSFPNLSKLIIANQLVEKIEGLENCSHLEELWITECKLKQIEGLNRCGRLKRLYLYANSIKKIENLQGLTRLENLWLNENQITKIEGLSDAKSLRELNLASNQIRFIGQTLAENGALEVLNLADNKISSFQDITILTTLSKLRNVAFSDPLYGGKCPVATMANYHVHILYHLPQLEYIDGLHISSRQVAEQAEATVTKKKMWYHMKRKTLEREYEEFHQRLVQLRKRQQIIPEEQIRILSKTIQRYKQEIQYPDRNLVSHQNFERNIEILRQRVLFWQTMLNDLSVQFETAETIFNEQKSQQMSRIQLELISGGNIRFEEGSTNDLWFNAAKDLLLSRFCSSIYSRYNITGIQIHRITRLFNRPKKLQFDQSLDFILEEEEDQIKTKSIQSKLEYFFYCFQPVRAEQHEHMHKFTTIEAISEHGFPAVELYKQLGQEEAIPFSNSLAVTDYQRIESSGSQNRDKFRFGSVLLAKVYVGSSTGTFAKELPFPDFKPDPNISARNYPTNSSVSRHVSFPERAITKNSQCDCANQQQQWFIFDPAHAYAEYIIDFEYLFSSTSKTFPDQISRIKSSNVDESIPAGFAEEVGRDNFVLPSKDDELSPKIKNLNEENILTMTNENNLSNIVELNLTCCNLQSIKFLSQLKNVRTLNLTFNELTRVDDLSYFYSLESVDLSYNRIVTFEGIKALTKLTILTGTNNVLRKSLDEILILKRYASNILHLDLRSNPFDKIESFRSRTLAIFPSLVSIDGIQVTLEERRNAQKANGEHVCSLENLAEHGRTHQTRPRDLRAHFVAKHYELFSNDPLGVHLPALDDIYWMSKVTSLCLNNVFLTKLPDLSHFISLRWASFDNNCLTKIQGLEQSVKLEELSMENNFLTILDGLETLTSLRRLNVSKNQIEDFEGQIFLGLTRLSYLAIDNNRLHSLIKLSRCLTIIELYAGNNSIKNIRDIFYLKSLNNLLILDLWGNPICREAEKYRLFIIYHLKSLRAFDGFAVEIQESGEARETFGGKLTADFIVEKLGHSNFSEIKQLELPQCSIRGVELNVQFVSLKCINLEHNQLTNFSGLIVLPNLKVLCLNYNRIESILPRTNRPRVDNRGKSVPEPVDNRPVLENLEVLHLAYNNITDLVTLQLNKLPSLRSLFLQGNEISKIEGLESLRNLRELVLDKNKIRVITETSFFFQTNLIELHLEENRIRELTHFDRMVKLEKLFIGSNKVQEVAEVEKLNPLICLTDLSLLNNPVSRKTTFRFFVAHRLPQVQILDEQLISEDERFRAEIYYADSSQSTNNTGNMNELFPGLLTNTAAQQQQQQQQQQIRSNPIGLNEGYSGNGLIEQIRQRQIQIRMAASNVNNGSNAKRS